MPARTPLEIRASVGVSIYPRDAATIEDLMRHTDVAMYMAKAGGKDAFHVYRAKATPTGRRARLAVPRAPRALRWMRASAGRPRAFSTASPPPSAPHAPMSTRRSGAERSGSSTSCWRSPSGRSPTGRPSSPARSPIIARPDGGIALDDVGADVRSLALVPLIEPDVIKLDLGLVQDRPSTDRAAIVSAVAAERELLLAMSHHMENRALRIGGGAVVLAAFQDPKHFSPHTVRRYEMLARGASLVAALGVRLSAEPVPGVRGAHIDPDDPLSGEWSVIVVGPHFAGALVAQDLGDTGRERDRRFVFATADDRGLVIAAARTLLARIAPVSVPPGAPIR